MCFRPLSWWTAPVKREDHHDTIVIFNRFTTPCGPYSRAAPSSTQLFARSPATARVGASAMRSYVPRFSAVNHAPVADDFGQLAAQVFLSFWRDDAYVSAV